MQVNPAGPFPTPPDVTPSHPTPTPELPHLVRFQELVLFLLSLKTSPRLQNCFSVQAEWRESTFTEEHAPRPEEEVPCPGCAGVPAP